VRAFVEHWWPSFASALVLLVTIAASGHAALNKREVRAATGWIGIIALVPGIGAVLYFLFGINRIRRRAARARAETQRFHHEAPRVPPEALGIALGDDAHLAEIARVVDKTATRVLLEGNRITPLRNGDEAYPAMIAAIDAAERSIALASYIFDNDRAGRRFVEALVAARARGVEIRILIDDAGARYSIPSIDRSLRAGGVKVARFMPVLLPTALPYANLRNHRKVLVVDGRIGFTGGMNIREGCILSEPSSHPTQDLHFRVEGPVVVHLMELFAEDWTFATREVLDGPSWYPPLARAGDAFARGIGDGPDEDLDKLRWAILGALGAARRSIRIVTPYFLPDEPLVAALNTAALRGLEVDVVIPAEGNLRFVQWATWGELWKILHCGVRVFVTPPPFDHTKLLVVDGGFVLLGSANWDPRSLRLNFELGVEVYDRALGAAMDRLVDEKVAAGRRVGISDVERQSDLVKLRNGFARLFSPYL
jgi:cardiolipin synthase